MKINSNNETYNFKYNNNIYQLNINLKNHDIQFTINKLSNSIDYYFTSKINLENLFNNLGLNISMFKDSDKIFSIFTQIYQKNKMSISQIDEESINLVIHYTPLNEEIKYEIQLNKIKMNNDDKFNVLYNQINLLTNKLNYHMNDKINDLKNEIIKKNNIIQEIVNKVLDQEEVIKDLKKKYESNKIMNKIEDLGNKINTYFNEYNKEINNIKKNLIKNINDQLNTQNNIIKSFEDKNDNIKFNESKKYENHNIDKNVLENNIIGKDNKIMEFEKPSIIQGNDSKSESNEKAIKEILKEMSIHKNNKLLNQSDIYNNISHNTKIKEIIINENNDNQNNNINILNSTEFNKEENSFKNYTSYKKKINYKFKENPKNLKYKLDLINTNTNWGANDIFEVFLCYKDNIDYISSPNYINNYIDIYRLIDNKIILSLEGHHNRITSIRYFINKNNNEEYLISSDYNKIVFIWDISNNYKIKHKLLTNYKSTIYSCLLIFPKDINNNFVITSTYNLSNEPEYSATKLYSLDNGKYIKHINNTNNEKIYYLLSWYNNQNNKYYIIQLAFKKIIISDLLKDELFFELIDKYEYYHYSGFIYNQNNIDYLCSSTSNGNINIWDLFNKKIVKNIYINNSTLFHIIKWNDIYTIVADYNNKSFKVINIHSGEIIKDINGQHNEAVKCIKKIYHPFFGESLLTSGEDKIIKLWTI